MVIPGGIGVAAIVLAAVLLIGVVVGRSRGRFLLLLGGLVAIGVAGVVIAYTGGTADKAAAMVRFYSIVVPVGAAFLAGWLCARGSLFKRLVVIAAAAILVAVFPFDAAGKASANVVGAVPTQGR
ncbi:hypothetical protein [Pseudonocardia sp. GCM10023141]|uniref:hypothetical protein n=1 Tax=Pseudonocardia sp. GCM10023141 TaxID=3252653 RepID=UPI003614A682